MFEIKSVQTKEEQQKICELCGIDYDADCMAYAAFDNNKLLGVSQFRILDGYAVIYDLANAAGVNDTAVLVIIGKATLNFIDLCGVHDAIIKPEAHNLPELLGFKRDAHDVWRVNLDGYFNAQCCKHMQE